VPSDPNRRFGLAWLLFAGALAVHVWDEAAHNFLSVYNPTARAIRGRFPFLPLPVFSFRDWLILLGAAILLLLALSPFVFRGVRWLKIAAIPVALLAGLANGTLHLLASLYYGRWMPGVYSAPLLLAAGGCLLHTAGAAPKNRQDQGQRARSVSAA
jgi:hypothetical protein